MITVLIVDDHDIVREGLKQIVSETNDIVVGGEAHSGADRRYPLPDRGKRRRHRANGSRRRGAVQRLLDEAESLG